MDTEVRVGFMNLSMKGCSHVLICMHAYILYLFPLYLWVCSTATAMSLIPKLLFLPVLPLSGLGGSQAVCLAGQRRVCSVWAQA